MGYLHYNALLVMLMKNIQTSLLSAFEASNLTYDDLSKRTNLPKSALYRYINGDTEKIPIDRFQAICHELNVDASELLGWKEDHPKDPLPDSPRTVQARFLAQGVDTMPAELRDRIVNMMISGYPEFFKGVKYDDENDT